MADFATAVNKVLNLEGHYQDDPADWGNYSIYDDKGNRSRYGDHLQNKRAGTKYGISAAFYSGVLGRQVTAADIMAITKNRAIALYRRFFWDSFGGDQITSQSVAEIIFDSLVQHSSTGAKIVQRVLNALGANIAEDGIIGPQTRAAIHQVNPQQLISGILQYREAFYKDLVQRRPSNQKFLKGWLKRLQKWGHHVQGAAAAGMPWGIAAGLVFLMYKMAKK